MTQFGESVGIGDIVPPGGKWECPFKPHEGKKDRIKNHLVGVGTTLGTSMGKAQQTIRNPDEERSGVTAIERPKFSKEKPVSLVVVKGETRNIKSYKLTCAAHHLIPAQASLKGCELIPWIKQGKKIAGNIGYDVNGVQNGVWLPGNYAMRGRWKRMADPEDTDSSSPPSDGPNSNKHEDTQFGYAVCAMELVKAQFHDAHPTYSKFVRECLNKVAALMAKRKYFCSECAKANEPLPPPYKLVHRINRISKRMKGYLVGRPEAWRVNACTSRFVRLYVLYVKSKSQKRLFRASINATLK
jgi:hypothetical protein